MILSALYYLLFSGLFYLTYRISYSRLSFHPFNRWSLLLMPITVISFSAGQGPAWLGTLAAYLGRGQPVYLILYISMVVFFAFFYTAVVFNPEETSENLKNQTRGNRRKDAEDECDGTV